uniref:Uncharacterized protein n=1 Tax=Myotis myotis TaxID=51298 RepID=A0A7J7QU31_MYOMY|nr:hypothetical protein mMyoMyo1_011573 [Myotis myotis]
MICPKAYREGMTCRTLLTWFPAQNHTEFQVENAPWTSLCFLPSGSRKDTEQLSMERGGKLLLWVSILGAASLWLPEKEKTLSITQRLPGWELLQEHVSLASELGHAREAMCARVCVCSCTRCVHVSAYTCTGMCSCRCACMCMCRCIHGRKRTF